MSLLNPPQQEERQCDPGDKLERPGYANSRHAVKQDGSVTYPPHRGGASLGFWRKIKIEFKEVCGSL
jgi:hypothetical protein